MCCVRSFRLEDCRWLNAPGQNLPPGWILVLLGSPPLGRRGAVLVAMLALKVVRDMESKLQARFGTTASSSSALTPNDALRALSRLCYERLVVGGQSFLRLPQPDERQQAILEALQVSFPTRTITQHP